MKFEEVLQALRDGKSIRRQSWHPNIGTTSLKGMDTAPFWRTYIEADDWEVVDNHKAGEAK